MKHRTKFNTKNLLKVEGKMSEKAADFYGRALGIAAVILAIGIASAVVIFSLRW